MDRPLSVPNDKLTRWHPKFPLDQIAEVESADLPQPPAVKTYNTAKDVLDKARVVINPRVSRDSAIQINDLCNCRAVSFTNKTAEMAHLV